MKKSIKTFHNLVLTEIELVNIRCFQKFNVHLEQDDNPILWSMFLGDNATGKTTLLRSIALGLCGESDAIALMKEVSGGFLRKGNKEGHIKLRLRGINDSSRTYTITTRISKKSDDAMEIVRQKTEPATDFPWSDVFVCGYGANRSAQAYNSYENYSVSDAVKSLFDYQFALQNPEVVLLRREPEIRQQLEQKLLRILMLDSKKSEIIYPKSGFELRGPWGQLPFSVLSDGYQSTIQWVLDFIGWLIYAERLIDNPDIGGILLLDEIEQHLHPRWQRYIVQRLRKQFPKTQIIATTHTPLTASGVVDLEHSALFKLELTSDGAVENRIIDKRLLAGKRADQVLASDAFGLVTSRNPNSEDEIEHYAALLGKVERTEAEEAELQQLRTRLQQTFRGGESPIAQTVEEALDKVLKDTLQNVSEELLDAEAKKQLREIFRKETSR